MNDVTIMEFKEKFSKVISDFADIWLSDCPMPDHLLHALPTKVHTAKVPTPIITGTPYFGSIGFNSQLLPGQVRDRYCWLPVQLYDTV